MLPPLTRRRTAPISGAPTAVEPPVGLSFSQGGGRGGPELVAQPHGGALKSGGKPASHPTKPTAVFTAVWRALPAKYPPDFPSRDGLAMGVLGHESDQFAGRGP